MGKKIIKTLTTRLFVALIVLGMIGWIILFGKNLPSSYTPAIYVLIGLTIVASFYVYWKKPEYLKNKKIVAGLIFFILIGVIGWITSFSEITGCRPYKCNEEFICAKPTDLGLKITTGECTSEFIEEIDYTCIKKEDTCVKQSLNEFN